MERSLPHTSEEEKNLLIISSLTVLYGKAKAVVEVSMKIREGIILGLIGPNGAGKSTILKTISGIKRATAGKIWFGEDEITHLSPREIVRRGIAHVPEGSQVFGEMTVLDNLLMGAYLRKNTDRVGKDLDIMFEHFPILRERRRQKAGTLSGGERQMVAVARAFMAAPKLLLMDEPSLGLSPMMVAEVERIIRILNKAGISITVVEQNAQLALSLSHYIYVLETGHMVTEGTPDELTRNENIREAYLGF